MWTGESRSERLLTSKVTSIMSSNRKWTCAIETGNEIISAWLKNHLRHVHITKTTTNETKTTYDDWGALTYVCWARDGLN